MGRKHLSLVLSLLIVAGTLEVARCEEDVGGSYLDESNHDPAIVPFPYDDDLFDRSDKNVEHLETVGDSGDGPHSDTRHVGAAAGEDDMHSSTSNKVETVKVQKSTPADKERPESLHDSLVSQVVAVNQQQGILQQTQPGGVKSDTNQSSTTGNGNNQIPLTPFQFQSQQQQLYAQSADGQMYALTPINSQQAANLQAESVRQAQAQQLQLQAQVQQLQAAQLKELRAQLAALTKFGGPQQQQQLEDRQQYFNNHAFDLRDLLPHSSQDAPEHSAQAYEHHGDYFDEPQLNPDEAQEEFQLLPAKNQNYPKNSRPRTQEPEVVSSRPPPPPSRFSKPPKVVTYESHEHVHQGEYFDEPQGDPEEPSHEFQRLPVKSQYVKVPRTKTQKPEIVSTYTPPPSRGPKPPKVDTYESHEHVQEGEYSHEPQSELGEEEPEFQLVPVKNPNYPKVPRTRTQKPEVVSPPPPPASRGQKPPKVVTYESHEHVHQGEYFDESPSDPAEEEPEFQLVSVKNPNYPKVPRTRTQKPEVTSSQLIPPPPAQKSKKVYIQQSVGPPQAFVEQAAQDGSEEEADISGADVNTLVTNVGLGYTPIEDTPHYTVYRVKDPEDEAEVENPPEPTPPPKKFRPGPSPSYKSKYYSSLSPSPSSPPSTYYSSPSPSPSSSNYYAPPSPSPSSTYYSSSPSSPPPTYRSSGPTYRPIHHSSPKYQSVYSSHPQKQARPVHVKPFKIVHAPTIAPYKETPPPHLTKPQTVYKSSADPNYNRVKTELILSFSRDRLKPRPPGAPSRIMSFIKGIIPTPSTPKPQEPPKSGGPLRRPGPPPPGYLPDVDSNGDTPRVRDFERKPFRASPEDLGPFHAEALFESHRRQPVGAHSISRPKTVHPPSFSSKYVDIDYSPGIALPPNEAAFAAVQARRVGGPAFVDPGYLTSALGYELNGKVLEPLDSDDEDKQESKPRPTIDAEHTAPEPVVVKSDEKETSAVTKEDQTEKPQVAKPKTTKVPPSTKAPPSTRAPPPPSSTPAVKKPSPVPKVELKDIKVSRNPVVPHALLAKILKSTTGDEFELENYY